MRAAGQRESPWGRLCGAGIVAPHGGQRRGPGRRMEQREPSSQSLLVGYQAASNRARIRWTLQRYEHEEGGPSGHSDRKGFREQHITREYASKCLL